MNIDSKYLKREFSNPFNYTGSKHRYLADLFEVLPDLKGRAIKVLDPFVGGGDLISKLPESCIITSGDASRQLVGMHNGMLDGEICKDSALEFSAKNNLGRASSDEYLALKDKYNASASKSPLALYSLVCHSNSNRMRFAKRTGDFNVPFGKRFFNENMQAKLDNYRKWLERADVSFHNRSFDEWEFNSFDLLLIDSPYPNSVACYNEHNGWTLNQELKLYVKINDASNAGVKFVYFGQTWANGKHNPTLENWSNQYNVKTLKDTSYQCSANRKNDKTVEIMVWN